MVFFDSDGVDNDKAVPMTGAFGGTHLKASDLLWGPHSIDHFADYSNTKLLRFNSRI